MIADAPWTVNDQFFFDQKFDYLALDEGTSVDPACDKFRLKGYDALKKIGEYISVDDAFLTLILSISQGGSYRLGEPWA